MRKKPIVVAYDICCNKVRTKIYKTLKEWRIGGQKSVHECRLSKGQAEELFLQLSEPLSNETDCLLMAWLEPHRGILYRGLGRDDINRKLWHIR